MKITRETDYAFRMVLFLTDNRDQEKVGAKLISDSMVIPMRFTLKILRKLNIAGLIRSFRGAKGGFALNRPPHEITIKDVIVAIEGPIFLNPCLLDDEACTRNAASTCPVHVALAKAQTVLIDELEKINFAALAQQKD